MVSLSSAGRLALLAAALIPVRVAAYTPEAPPALARPVRPAAVADTVWTWPERAQNLQVLPGSTSADELRQTMQSFTRALGVRCSNCHVGSGRDFRTWDFASDVRGHKDVARAMMRMTMEINARLVPAALGAYAHGEGAHPEHAEAEHAEVRVTCWTCHRGQSEPETMPATPPDSR